MTEKATIMSMNTHPSDLLPLDQAGAGLILTPCPGTKGVPPGVALEQFQFQFANGCVVAICQDVAYV